MDLQRIKYIYLVGIKGVGMAGLALIFSQLGKRVYGSDVAEDFVTKKALSRAGIKPDIGFTAQRIDKLLQKADDKSEILLITTGAHGGYTNPQVRRAKQLGIETMSHAEALGKLMDLKKMRISVAGTHGKTTTAAMIAHILSRAGSDPAYLTGTGSIASLGDPAGWGIGDYFVAEADEYVTEPNEDSTPRFLWQDPTLLTITNIEYDHPDVFQTMNNLRGAFTEFAKKVPDSATVIASIDSPELEKGLKNLNKRVLFYGYSPRAQYRITDYKVSRSSGKAAESEFNLVHGGKKIGRVRLGIAGRHNAENATAALLTATEAGISWRRSFKSLKDFHGCGRRLEYIAKKNDCILYDDYAHHPTEIKATLRNIREIYPDYETVAVFQPHTYSRTKALFSEFASAFVSADRVVLTDIFSSAREEPDSEVSSKKLAVKIRRYRGDVVYSPSLNDVIEYLSGLVNKQGKRIIVTMGAGDIYKIHKELIN